MPRHRAEYLEESIPAYRLLNSCNQGCYQIEKEILTDPRRVVVQHGSGTAYRGPASRQDASRERGSLYFLLARRKSLVGGGLQDNHSMKRVRFLPS